MSKIYDEKIAAAVQMNLEPCGLTKQGLVDIEGSIGGVYDLPDRQGFWMDTAVVREIMRRAVPVITAEIERHTRHAMRPVREDPRISV